MTGVTRAIAELEKIDPDKYENNIAVVLVADGADRLGEDFIYKAHEHGLLDKNYLNEQAFKMSSNDNKVHREYKVLNQTKCKFEN